jgi:hypothetical protein
VTTMEFKWKFCECEKEFHLRIIGDHDEGGIWMGSNLKVTWGPTFREYIPYVGKNYER